MIQTITFFTILTIVHWPAKADDPHTFSHAADEAGYNVATTRLSLSFDGIELLDGLKNYTAAEQVYLYGNVRPCKKYCVS